jgi:hypothetical protein
VFGCLIGLQINNNESGTGVEVFRSCDMQNQLAKMLEYWQAQRNVSNIMAQLSRERDARTRARLEEYLSNEQRRLHASS